MISDNSPLLTFKVNEVELKSNWGSGAAPQLSYMLIDSQTSQPIYQSPTFEPSQASGLPSISLQSANFSSLVLSFYVIILDGLEPLGSIEIDLNKKLKSRTWLKIPSEGDEILSIELEIIKEETIEATLYESVSKSELIQESEKCIKEETVEATLHESVDKSEFIQENEKFIKEETIEATLYESIGNSEFIQENEKCIKEEAIEATFYESVSKNEFIHENEKYIKEEAIEATHESVGKSVSCNKEETIEAILHESVGKCEFIQERKKCENPEIVREENKNEEEMNELLRLYEIDDINSVAEKIEEVKEDIAFYNRKKNYAYEEVEKKKLVGLERLLKLHEEIKKAAENEEAKQNVGTSEEENLEEELKQGLSKYNIDDPQRLEELIHETKKSINFYLKKKKIEDAKNEENILSDLEKLHSIYINLTSKSIKKAAENDEAKQNVCTSEEEKLEEELKQGLSKHNIDDPQRLEELINETKENISFYLKKKKFEDVKIEENTLSDLEKLHSIYINLTSKSIKNVAETDEAKQNVCTSEEENLEKELNQGLSKYNIDDPQRLEELINETKESISFYLKRKKFEEAKNEENTLSNLEKLHSIYIKLNSKSMIIIDSEAIKNQKKIEFVEGMINDFSTTPHCIEKYLASILCFAYYKIYNFSQELDIHTKIESIDPNIAFNYVIDYLNKSHKGILPERLISHFKKYFKNQSWDKLIENTEKILKEYIRPINVKELSRLINKSAQCSQNLENKDIILLIGFTGSGKSTTTHFLCGSEMKRITEDNVIHIKCTSIKTSLLENVAISPRPESETRYISMIPIEINASGEFVHICDTPGLLDTNGYEVDIANTISIVECVKKCRSVRPLILLSAKAEGDKFEGVKKLAHNLARLVPNFGKYKNSFTYAFTKYTAEDAKNIHPQVKNALKLIKNHPDKAYLKILEDIEEKTINEVITINPLRDNPQELLIKIIENQPITDTRDAFESFITEDSSRAIKSQLSVYSKGIITALDSFNYEIIKHNMDGLKFLVSLFRQFDYQYNESVDYVIKKTNYLYDNAVDRINKILEKHGILEENDIISYKEAYCALKASEEIRESHLRGETVRSAVLINNLIVNLNLANASAELINIDLNIQLKNFKILSAAFEEIAVRYKVFSEEYLNLIDSLLKSADSYLENNNYEKFAESLLKLKKCFEAAYGIMDLEDSIGKYQYLIRQFIASINAKYYTSIELLNKGYIEKKDIEVLHQNINSIKSAIEIQGLIDITQENERNSLIPLITNKYKEYFEKVVLSFINNESTYDLVEIQAKFEEYNLLIEISDIKAQITPYYQDILDFVVKKIKSFHKEAKRIIKSFIKSHNSIDLEPLRDCFKRLESGRWIQKYKEDINLNEIPYLEKDIRRYMGKLLHELINLDLGIDSPFNVQKGFIISKKSDIIFQLKEFIPSVSDFNKAIWDEFWKRIYETIKYVKREFNPEEKDIENEKKIIENLKILTQVDSQYINCDNPETPEELFKNSGFETIEQVHQELKRIQEFVEIFKEKMMKIPDIDNLENSYTYIEECKKISELPEGISEIIYSNIFLKASDLYNRYLNSLIKDLNVVSDYIKNNNNMDINSLKVNACRLSLCFNEISILNTKSPSFFKSLNIESPFAQFKIQLRDLYSDINTKIKTLFERNQIDSITSLLAIIEELAKLDSNFLNLSHEYKMLQDSELQELFESIENHQFYRFKQMMEKQNDSIVRGLKGTIIEKLYKTINDTLKDMASSVKTLNGSDLKHDQIEIICKMYKDIDHAQCNNIYVYFDQNTRDKFITEQNRIKKELEPKIFKYLTLISNDIRNKKFYEAEIKMKNFPLSTKEDLKYIFPIKFGNDVANIELGLNEFPQKIIDDIKTLEIKDFKVHPPKLTIMYFEKASEEFPKYIGKSNEIKNLINEKLNNINNNFAAETIPNRKKIISEISHILDTLPEDIKILAQSIIDNLKKSTKTEKNNFKERIDLYENQKKIQELCAFYKESKKNQSDQNLCYAQSKLRNILYSIQAEISSDLDKRNWIHAFYKFNVLALKDEVKEIIGDSELIFKDITSKLYETINSNLEILRKIEYRNNSSELTESLNFYKIFVNFKNNLENANKPTKISSIENIIESMHKAISDFYLGLRKSYTEFKPPNNPLKCNEALNKIKDWDEFLKSFQEYLSKSLIQTTYDDHIRDQWRYPKYRNDLYETLKKLKEFFEDFKIQYDDIKHQALLENYAKIIQEKWNQIRNFDYVSSHLGQEINLEIIKSKAINSIRDEMNSIVKNALSLIDKPDISKEEFNQIRSYYNFLEIFEKNLKIEDLDLKITLKAIEDKIYDKTREFKEKAEVGTQLKEIVGPLINMKEISNSFPLFKKGLDKILDDFLETLGSNSKGMICAIIGELENNSNGLYILTEHKFFEGVMKKLWQKKTQTHGIDYALEKINGSYLNTQVLREKHQEYVERFQETHKKYQAILHNQGLDEAISQIVAEMQIMSTNNAVTVDNPDISKFQNFIPKLLAHVSMLWELCSIKKYNKDIDGESEENEIFMLHPIQVLSIFRMIGIGYEENSSSKNNLVQIPTGEGKSITLAFLSSMLALLGFTVNCACYSEHLSKRDYEEFEPLYTALNVCSYISYGTFNKLCEDEINSNGDVRNRVLNLIKPGSCTAIISDVSERPKILLIDEVDVFFTKSFYGNIYRPLAKLKDPSIGILTDYIWKHREILQNTDIKATNEYKNCCNQFLGYEFLIEEAVKDMKNHVRQFDSHDYIVQHDKIGYKEHDGISFNKTYGYNTLFAYYFEHEKGRITQESLKENKFIGIKCGMFSFAEIPHEFKYIMGVTGTLETLGNYEKNIIENKYDIKLQTFMPSVFGENRRTFGMEEDVHVENSEEYYMAIMSEINEKIGTKGSKRAVLVFFEDESKLMDFYNKSTLQNFDYDIQLMTESLSAEDRGMMIKKATVPNTVTLLIRVFGRGIDFKCCNQELESYEGVHVLQTFFSEDISEETQIKGRSARQGQKGSYSMILLDKELEKILVSEEDIKTMRGRRSFYNDLSKKRNEFNEIKNTNQSAYLDEYRASHTDSINFLGFIKNNDISNSKEFLRALNKGISIESEVFKTIILMDATGSMSLLLQNAKNTVKTMFERVCTVLSEKGINSECFQLQYCAYRNYSSGEDKILQASPWTNKPDILEGFLENVKSEGGQGNEAIEVGLWHVNNAINKETVSQVILIGDYPPNTIKDIETKRGGNANYWNKTKFKNVGHYRRELGKIEEQKVPINAFYVYSAAEKKFKKIAALTGGQSDFLNINSSSGAERLTDLVSTQVLSKVGGEDAVSLYWKKYPISYT